MKTAFASWVGLGCILAASCTVAPHARAQYASEPIVVGTGGYVMNFDVEWTCDDFPSRTTSAPGEVDLVDWSGKVVASITATANQATPVITVSGGGYASNVTSSILIEGAGGTPADGLLHASWNIAGPAPGPYTLHLWVRTRSVPNQSATSITTDTRNSGGGGPVNAPTPTPTPTPTPPPPSISLSAPAAAAVFQTIGLSASASVAAGGRPLASVVIAVSLDNGRSWSAVVSDGRPSSPSDSERASYAFALVGSALLRATATDSAGLSATSTQAVSVGKAAQRAIAISPPAVTVVVGQGIPFVASGGATGNYSWGGSATGAGAAQTVIFASPGTFFVTAVDIGNNDYSASPMATAAVTVRPASYTLTAVASAGGTVAGGGSYPPDTQAMAVATAGPGNVFTGWTGDVTGSSPSISVLMDSNKSVTAHFSALLPQTISFVSPGPVTMRTPAFILLATSSSGLPVTLTLDSGPAALSANLVTPSGSAGEVILTATQPGNAQYLPAQPVVISFAIGMVPVGVLFADDSAATRKSDKTTPTTSYTSVAAH